MRIVIPEGAEFVQKPEHLDPLRRLGELVVSPGHPRDKADFIERVKDADAVVLDYTLMDEEVLARCPRLKFVAFLGIGYASCIDIEAATRRGIVVSNTPDYGATSVAEHALGMILALTRHIATSYVSLKRGAGSRAGSRAWSSTARPSAWSASGPSARRWPGSGPASA